MDENWFYCENPEKLEISMTDENGNVLRTLEKDDPERLSHLELYNDPEMVMARIGKSDRIRKADGNSFAATEAIQSPSLACR